MDRSEKRAFVSSFRETLKANDLVVVVRQKGLTVAEADQLRSQARSFEAGFKVVKNSLARLCINGTPCEALDSFFVGPTAIAFSKSPVAAAKAVVEFSKKNEKLQVVAGVLQGRLLDVPALKTLADLPSLEELRAQLLGVVMAPATRLAGVLGAPAQQLARVISAYAEK